MNLLSPKRSGVHETGSTPTAKVGDPSLYARTTVREDARYFLTCNLEYARCMGAADASQVFHGQGKERLEFFEALFRGELNYAIVAEWR